MEKLTEFWADLNKQVYGDVKTDDYSLTLYSTDASIYQVRPLGVFFPQHADDVQAAVEIAAKHQVPVLMRGGGTALAGQTVNKALVIDTSRHMDKVLEINPEERWAKVQPGLVLDNLQAQTRPQGLQFGPDPASSNRATLGGIVSNNSTGSHSIVYGMSVDHVLGAKVVLSDGTPMTLGAIPQADLAQYQQRAGLEGQIYRGFHDIISTQSDIIRQGFDYHWRRCGGYNLAHFIDTDTYNLAQLICGAEGTLAALNEITVKLVEQPQHTVLGIIHFGEAMQALEAVPQVLETQPSAVEIMDDFGLNMCRSVPSYARLLTFLDGFPGGILITEYTGSTQAEAVAKLDGLAQFIRQRKLGTSLVRAESAQQQANVWNVRKVSLGLIMSMKGDHKPIPFIEDSAVPVEHLAEYVARLSQFCGELDVAMPYYAHASAGCLHIRPLINLKEADDIQKMEDISRAACELVLEYGGAWSSEHGDGRARSYMNEHFFGPDLYNTFRQVKTLFDPHNLMNPGNVVDAGPMTENLRYGPTYQTLQLQEHLDFSTDHGFFRAVEMCNGAGVCRKGSGTMCPSYMVTKDEEHSTRGRANLLRAALSGALPPEELTSQRMFEAMDLCIECKGCKSECPSSVDMAKIKFEFLGHYYEQNPISLRTKLFAYIPALSKLACGPLAPAINWVNGNKLVRLGLERFMGIGQERSLPPFVVFPFTTWFDRFHTPHPAPNAKRVVLFTDTFNNYNYPEVSIAALEVLEAAGFEVILSNHGCCGRPMISKGLVNEARAAALETVTRLAPFAQQGLPIVGLEPSCILSLGDEYLSLLPESEEAKLVAQHIYTFEEFMAEQMDDPDFQLSLSEEKLEMLLHGHCHQKSLVGTDPAKKMLGMLGTVSEVDSGCCGMAGSFGYEAEHYDISVQMAERKLLPAIREAEEKTLVAAGVSCRQQIKHNTGRQALHPAQVLQQQLKKIED